MTDAPPLTDHLVKPPTVNTQCEPCGCIMVTVQNRAALALLCTQHIGKVQFVMRPNDADDPSTGLYELARTSCACGGSWAWLRVRPSGACEMVGCACHFTPEKFGVSEPT